MKNKELKELLCNIGACRESLQWLGDKNAQEAWGNCPRGDWMLWLAGRVIKDRKLIVLAACACARLVLKFVKPGENRPKECIETVEMWCAGKATIEQVKEARNAAYAADAAAAYAADAAAAAAAYAAYAAAAAAAAAAYAAYAADAAAAAAYAAYAADARNKMQLDCATEVAKVISFDVIKAAAEDITKK